MKVTFCYREGNYMMERVIQNLLEKGIKVEKKTIPAEKSPNQVDVENLLNGVQGQIASDLTMKKYVVGRSGGVIDLYNLIPDSSNLHGLKNKFKPLLEVIRCAGKTPVLLDEKLDDHLYLDDFSKSFSESEMKSLGNPETDREVVIKVLESMAVEVITQETFLNDSREDIIYLIDHHVNSYGLPIMYICPCCMKRNRIITSSKRSKDDVFNPPGYMGFIDFVANKVIEKLK